MDLLIADLKDVDPTLAYQSTGSWTRGVRLVMAGGRIGPLGARTTCMAVTFSAATIVGGIALWMFSTLHFQAEMAQLLVVLMIIKLLGAITIVPAFFSIFRPRVATSLLRQGDRGASECDEPSLGR